MKHWQVNRIIELKYQAYSQNVVEQIKGLGPESRTSGDDSGLEDVWEEFKSQIQEQHSIFFDLYVETIEGMCRNLVDTLPEHEILLLWLTSDGYFNNRDEEHIALEQMRADVSDELYSHVSKQAADEEMEEPDDKTEEEQEDLFN